MTGPRIFIIILVLLGVLFVVEEGIGLHQNDAQPTNPNSYSPPSWTSSLDWLSPSVDLTTVQAAPGTCLQAAQKTIKVAAKSTCTLKVPTASSTYRKMKLHLVTGASVEVTYNSPTPNKNLKNPQQLKWPPTGNAKDPQALVILADGGSVTFACGSGAPCQLQMQ